MYRTIDLFSGCGGLTLGFENEGFIMEGFIEFWEPAIKTFMENFPHAKIIEKDITKFDFEKVRHLRNKIDVIIGGPPCQGFSNAGKRDKNDPRNSLFNYFVKFVDIVRPKIFLMENVKGMLTMKNNSGEIVVDIIKKEFNKIGYWCDFKLLNAADFGVPQKRERVFFMGSKNGKKLNFPDITHSQNEYIRLDGEKINKWKTVRESIGDLEKLESGEKSSKDPLHFALKHCERHIRWLKNVPEGHTAHENKDPKLRPPSGYMTTYKRIWWDRPSPAITTCFCSISSQNNVHPEQTRAITIREATRLQSFPDDYQFKGSISSIRKQIGNAVPPKLAEKIAESIKKQLDNF